MAVSPKRRTLADVVADAEARITRCTPAGAHAAMQAGVLMIDIRSDSDRERDGVVPGSIHIPRTVLEWRVDVDSPSRNVNVGGLEHPLILLCDHGYSSILAAAALTDIGFTAAGDVIGGYGAWLDAGLPVIDAPRRRRRTLDEPAGMGTPDREGRGLQPRPATRL